MWKNFKALWKGMLELMDLASYEHNTWWEQICSKAVIFGVFGIIMAFNCKEFAEDIIGMRDSTHMFKECSICKDGYDLDTLDYKLMRYFCPTCVKSLPENAMALIERFRDWGLKQVDKNGRAISDEDVKGIVFSVFYAIKYKAPREPLYEALLKYTWGNIGDTLTLSDLLEELTTMQENKLKPLKGNTDVHLGE